MTNKDGKCLCLFCGRRVAGIYSAKGHDRGCPIKGSAYPGKAKV